MEEIQAAAETSQGRKWLGVRISAPALGAANWNKFSMQSKSGRMAQHDAREAAFIEENPKTVEMIKRNVVNRQKTMESLCGAPVKRGDSDMVATLREFRRR